MATSAEKRALRQRLTKCLHGFGLRGVLVAGDMIADEFLYGQTARISREAPVLVLEYRNLIRLPGGAANAANNLLDLGSSVQVSAVVGDDDAGRDLIGTLSRKGADVRNVSFDAAYHTPVKTRILAGAHHSAPQQIVRVDRVPEPDSAVELPLKSLPEDIRSIDAVIISDYGYSTVAERSLQVIRRHAARKHIPVLVDSRFRMSAFDRVTAITPNITELEASVGRTIGSDAALLRTIGQDVLKKQRLDYLLVTQGRFGMTLFQQGRPPFHIPIFGSDEVADVTGAGDTVIAVFTIALASGASPEDAARLANYAGGIVVMKRGTATVTCGELQAALNQDLL